ncbi:MAG: Arm DNA-binding domain-containing protein [Deltaproteobacteria bacterium]|jgi:hypothetical protein|nr:Arm DNA-binding domain-containing protein [Deltaproteobacteria bacterium]
MIRTFGHDLNHLDVKYLPPLAKAYRVYDGRGGGLFLEVLPSGLRKWRLRYRVGVSNRVTTLGSYPEMSPNGARKAAEQHKVSLPPQASSQSVQNHTCRTFGDLLDLWLDLSQDHFSVQTMKTKRGLLERHIRPSLGQIRFTALKPRIIQEKLLDPFRRLGHEATAKKVKTLCQQIFRFGLELGMIKTDPFWKLPDLNSPRGYRWPVIIDPDAKSDHVEAIRHVNGFKVIEFRSRSLDWGDMED